ncbi:MAG: DUF4430 domain-containing protein [Peptococcaceae bacterium]|nr:DUF4430 domain-containing protein [Peptococcaceae bacterium]
MKKYKTLIITVVAIIALLSGAWVLGGGYSGGYSGDDRGAASALAAQSGGSGAAPDDPLHEDADLDIYQTEPTPEGKPAPVEPQDAAVSDDAFTVTLSVRCDTIASRMDLLHADKRELVPADGVIYPTTEVTAYEGESVFNILQRELKRQRIHMEFRNTPIYNSAFIMGINNLYELDAGELSGWTYNVNGWFPNYGCSRYKLQPGDAVEWLYTCDLGRDLSESGLEGWQIDE